ncbi:hypothetical protein ACXDF8_03735 [Mycolicibacterium sp. CBM1]
MFSTVEACHLDRLPQRGCTPIATQIATGTLTTQARAVPLADVERVWVEPDDGQRVVFTP